VSVTHHNTCKSDPLYTACANKKTIPLMFDNNSAKCDGAIFKILSAVDLQGNFLCIHTKISPRPQYVATLPCKIRKCKNVTEFSRWTWWLLCI